VKRVLEDDPMLVHVNQLGDWSIPTSFLERGVREVLGAEGIREGELSLTFMNDVEIQALNQEYLGRDRPTDVIAFALQEEGDPLMGDVYVGYEQAERQAKEAGVEILEELLRLAVHGTLHVLGHDHPEGSERMESPMFRRQEELLAELLSEGEAP
jgi:probable rRNA maturation factor